jgi:hypothetical protein
MQSSNRDERRCQTVRRGAIPELSHIRGGEGRLSERAHGRDSSLSLSLERAAAPMWTPTQIIKIGRRRRRAQSTARMGQLARRGQLLYVHLLLASLERE